MYKSKYSNLMQHLMNEHDLILLDSEQQEIEKWVEKDLTAISVTRCCEELKVKEKLTFEEYLISKGYKLSNTYVWQIDNRDLSNEDIIKQRKQYEYSL